MGTGIESDLVTGNDVMDRQHLEIFRMIDSLHLDILGGLPRVELLPKLESLGVYVMQHFMTEEFLMTGSRYPHLDRHRRQHMELLGQGMEILRSLREGKLVLTAKLTRFLREWIYKHIQEEDVALAKWLDDRRPHSERHAAEAGWNEEALELWAVDSMVQELELKTGCFAEQI